jgi:hypothetical protein
MADRRNWPKLILQLLVLVFLIPVVFIFMVSGQKGKVKNSVEFKYVKNVGSEESLC